MKTKKVKRVVNSRSEEAKDFDFSAGAGTELIGGRLVGDVEFTWYVYYCDNCNIEITNKDMRKYEREKKEKFIGSPIL